MKNVKIVVFVPTTHTEQIIKAMGDAGAGVIGNYAYCSFISKGVGRYLPTEGAKPFIGQVGKFEEVEEERIGFYKKVGFVAYDVSLEVKI